MQLPINAAMREAWEEKWQTVELDGETKQLSFMEAAARLGVGVFASGPLLEGTLLKDAALQVKPSFLPRAFVLICMRGRTSNPANLMKSNSLSLIMF